MDLQPSEVEDRSTAQRAQATAEDPQRHARHQQQLEEDESRGEIVVCQQKGKIIQEPMELEEKAGETCP
jgi:hypothetical protein